MFLFRVEANISHNGNKSVANYTGPNQFIAMGVMYEMDIHEVDGMRAHTSRKITHRRRLVIEGCGNPSRVWNVVEKIGENNRKVRKTSWAISQTLALGLEHDKIQAWWASSVMLEKILKMVWWCRCFKMKSWSQTICYSKGRRHVHAKGNKRSYVALKCY